MRLERLTCRDFAKEKVKKTIRLIPGPCEDPLTIGKQEHQDTQKTSCKGQLEDGGREVDKKEDGEMTSEKRNWEKRRSGDDISDEIREER